MIRQIDHVVIAVRDLAAATADYETLGFTVVPGGEHTGGATHNALVSFRDGSYFELIAFKEPDRPQDHRWWPRLAKGEGLVDFALLSSDLDREAGRLNAASVTAETKDGGRLRPDGLQVAWKSAGLASSTPVYLPFLIEDVTPRERRVPNGAATSHQREITGIAGVTVAVASLDAASPAYSALLETEGESMTPSCPRLVSAHRYAVGRQWIALVQPADDSDIARHISYRGDGPIEITLQGQRAERLADDVAHGVALCIELADRAETS